MESLILPLRDWIIARRDQNLVWSECIDIVKRTTICVRMAKARRTKFRTKDVFVRALLPNQEVQPEEADNEQKGPPGTSLPKRRFRGVSIPARPLLSGERPWEQG